jgi:UDP-N-acetylmuramate--alanine ligase
MNSQTTCIPQDIGAIHFVGIGGIGMSGIAEVLISMNYRVQGSDEKSSANTERLIKKGAKIAIGHNDKNIEGASVVVYSSACLPDNPEITAAKHLGIPVIHRSEMLAELMRLKYTVCIAGTHGKTTTTSMAGCLLENAAFDPTIINGGIIPIYGTNTKVGKGEWVVAECDESDGSFLRLYPTVAVITNMDPEHMEHYGTFENVFTAYRSFVEKIPFYGFAILCYDHPEVRKLSQTITDRKIVTYGFEKGAAIRALNVEVSDKGSSFDIELPDGTIWANFQLNMLGEHNVSNATAIIALGFAFGFSEAIIKKAVSEFEGVQRRFTTIGEINNILLIDDYGHHPTEIKATLATAKLFKNRRKLVIFQPHRYTRLRDLMGEFANSFDAADSVAIAPTYAASELPIEGINSATLVTRLKAMHPEKEIFEIKTMEDIPEFVKTHTLSGDLVLFLGAGSISAAGYKTKEYLEK